MADEDARGGSAKAKFKSKWHRVFKEKEQQDLDPSQSSDGTTSSSNPLQPQKSLSWDFNDDVAAFLKPSIDAAAIANANKSDPTPPAAVGVPKLDIGLAKRWPSAQEVRAAASDTPNGFTKPTRRKGLVVGFVETIPEIIGEGGDECEEPTMEVGRRRPSVGMEGMGSVRSAGQAQNLAHAESLRQVQGLGQVQQPVQVSQQSDWKAEEDFGSDDTLSLRQVPTESSDGSPIMQRAEAAFAVPDRAPQLPRLSRTPTGFSSSSDGEFNFGRSLRFDEEEPPVPQLDISHTQQQPNPLANNPPIHNTITSPTAKSPSASDLRKRELASGEGIILRRASALIRDGDDTGNNENEEQKRQSLAMGRQPSSEQYDKLSRDDAPNLLPELPTPRSAVTPNSATSPSPFKDPKYLRHHSGMNLPEVVLPPESESSAPVQGFGEVVQRKPVATAQQVNAPVPSYAEVSPPAATMPEASMGVSAMPQIQQSQSSDENNIPARTIEQQPPAQQIQPQTQHPAFRQPQPPRIIPVPPPQSSDLRNEDQLTNMRVPSGGTSASPRPSGKSKYFKASPDTPGSRDLSPHQPLSSNSAASETSQAIYSKPNGSNVSLPFAPPAPGYAAHSRSSSRDSNSPQTQYSAGSAGQQSIPRAAAYTTSPPGGSPRSSWYGGKPSGSPLGSNTNLTPEDYSATPRAVPQRNGRSPLQYVQQGEEAGQLPPSSSHSNSNPQRPAVTTTFSPVKTVQPKPDARFSQQNRWSAAFLQYSDSERPGSSGSNMSDPRTVDRVTSGRPRADSNMSDPRAVDRISGGRPRADSGQRPQVAMRSMSGEVLGGERRPTIAPSESSPAAEAAYADFTTRVAHMKGVFRLTAERERPIDSCPPLAWLRTALWWYLSGKAGLESLLRQRSRRPDGDMRELLTQPHVDLAKAWWILSDPLVMYEGLEDESPQSGSSPGSGHPDVVFRTSIVVLKNHMKSLCLSMGKSQLMPPPRSLIQGQDTAIWLDYPRFTPDFAAVLGGLRSMPQGPDNMQPGLLPLDALPLGDYGQTFCYGRFPVDVSVNSDDPNTERMNIPCILSMLRGRRDFGTTIVIASQSELLTVKVQPFQDKGERITWYDVSWKNNPYGMVIRLSRDISITVRTPEKDFRSLWNLLKYAERVEDNLRPERDEKLVHEAQLAELQVSDSSNTNTFPPDKIRAARALIFERTAYIGGDKRERKVHRGYRLTLVTDPKNKSLACASHEVCRREPLYFEFITDVAAGGMAAMVVRIQEDTRQCRILLVFPDAAARQGFLDVLTGVAVSRHETIVGKMGLKGMNIELATQARSVMQEVHPTLRALKWQRLGVTNGFSEMSSTGIASTVSSESLRIVARHMTGCITDRINLGSGELLLRLPCADIPAIQIFRTPQEDMNMSIDTRNSDPMVSEGITTLSQAIHQQSTIRTYAFSTYEDLHAFQNAITGCSVRYDGLASIFTIARRKSGLPIHRKWEATKVRIQVITYDNAVKVLAFMEDFSHTDAMCFQIKSSDICENGKGDGKGKKWTVKIVDVRFSLPHIPENHNQEAGVTEDALGRVRRRFVNLEGLERTEEHEDVSFGFETVEERDRFAQALPANSGRSTTLKRRS